MFWGLRFLFKKMYIWNLSLPTVGMSGNTEIGRIMAEVAGVEVQVEPKWLLLLIPGEEDWPKYRKLWLARASAVAKCNFARNWGAQALPKMEDWEKDLDWCWQAEHTIYLSRGCPKKWEKIWGVRQGYRGE